MAGYVEVSADMLDRVASYFDEPIQLVTAINDWYITETTSLGPVWGDDHNGDEWAKVYLPTHASIIETHDAMGEGLRSFQQDIKTMANNYRMADDANSS
jgi:hypothetical protein